MYLRNKLKTIKHFEKEVNYECLVLWNIKSNTILMKF